MKFSPNDRKITERMAPGALCRDGFLGDDPRPYWEIIDHDRSTVENLGTSCGDIAEKLGKILKEAMVAYGTPVKVGEDLVAAYRESMGRIPSPFGGGVFPKGEIELTDTRTDRTVVFTPLTVQLIGEHCFFQGKGSRYRLEPETLAKMLDLGEER
ncbi:MAG: hypothetical protein ACLFVU_05430 [Phycisphaerae bacterium]